MIGYGCRPHAMNEPVIGTSGGLEGGCVYLIKKYLIKVFYNSDRARGRGRGEEKDRKISKGR